MLETEVWLSITALLVVLPYTLVVVRKETLLRAGGTSTSASSPPISEEETRQFIFLVVDRRPCAGL